MYKLLIVDDDITRKDVYSRALNHHNLELHFVSTREEFDKTDDEPFDGYLLDVFLESGDWGDINASELIEETISSAPRPAPIFLISSLWGDVRVLDILKHIGDSPAQVVQYLAWSEFEQATLEDARSKQRIEALQKKLIFELDRWHAKSDFHPESDETIRMLILSDVQYGDPNADTAVPFAEHRIAATLKEKNKLPDLLIIAGDISFSGSPDQFQQAEDRILNDLAPKIWGEDNVERNKERILVVPGNHDVNLRFSQCDNVKYNLDEKSFVPLGHNDTLRGTTARHSDYALEPFRKFAHNVTGDKRWISDSHLSWVDRRFQHWGLSFFVLNSVHELNADNPKRASLSEDALRDIARSLEVSDWASTYNIALSHHGLRPQGAELTETEISNWLSHVKEFFSLHKMRLWIYGHYHEYDTGCHNKNEFKENNLYTLQTPTSHIVSKERSFCLVELIRRNGVVVDARVEQYSMEKGSKLLSEDPLIS